MTGAVRPRADLGLLSAMPADAARVIEIGCGEGALAAAYLRRNPGCVYVGVERDAPAAAIAAGRMSRVLAVDPATMDDPGGPFDLVVIGDALDRLTAPETTLDRLRGWMAPGASLVGWARDAAHGAVEGEAMGGCGSCGGVGDDRLIGHSFTQQGLLALLRDRGFRPLRCRPCDRSGPDEERVSAAPTPYAARVTVAPTSAAHALDEAMASRPPPRRFAFVAERAADPARPFLRLHQVALAPEMMTARVAEPARLMAARPHVHQTCATRDLDVPQAPDAGGVLVVQRPRWPAKAIRDATLHRLRARGWVVVIEFDDDPALVARILGDPSPDIYHAAFAGADAVQTSTPHLARLIAPSNPEVAVFPNGVAALAPPRPARNGPPRVFYGALNRGAAGVRMAAAMEGLEAEFTVAHDRAVFDALRVARKRFLPALAYPAYLAQLFRSDVALMPLEGTGDEQGKSDLKWVEAAAQGCAAIVSPAVYAASVRDGETGLVAATPAAFRAALAALVADPGRAGRLAAAARAEVAATRMLGAQAPLREAWYRGLIDRRGPLRAAALAREATWRSAGGDRPAGGTGG